MANDLQTPSRPGLWVDYSLRHYLQGRAVTPSRDFSVLLSVVANEQPRRRMQGAVRLIAIGYDA